MDIILLLIICSAIPAFIFLIAFIVSTSKGQYDDLESPAVKILFDKNLNTNQNGTSNTNK